MNSGWHIYLTINIYHMPGTTVIARNTTGNKNNRQKKKKIHVLMKLIV